MTATERLNRALCKRSAHHFIFGVDMPDDRVHFVYTKDEHDKDSPKKPFPDILYLRVMLDLYLVGGRLQKPEECVYVSQWGLKPRELIRLYETGLLAVEKSRQVLVTWLTLAYCLWTAKFFEHRLVLVQSKREEDVKKLVCSKEDELDSARLSFMENNLPEYMKSLTTATKCNMYFDSGSHIWGIPQGGSIIRSHTPSLLFADEAAFQPEFEDAYTASLPAVRGGGQAIFVSTPELGAFQEIVEAKVK